MDIQTNVDMLIQADYKDWNHYAVQEKIQKLLLKLEEIKELEKDPPNTAKAEVIKNEI